MQPLGTLIRLLLAAFIGSLAIAQPAAAQVSWEDYQGNNRVTGTSNQDLPGPNYPNGSGSSATRLNALRTIAANPANAVRTGISASVNFTNASLTLCNLDSDTAGTGAACQADAQGRVIYAVMRLPFDGNTPSAWRMTMTLTWIFQRLSRRPTFAPPATTCRSAPLPNTRPTTRHMKP